MTKRISLLALFIVLVGCKKDVLNKDMMKADVTYLADDKLEGRQTGTPG